MWQKRNGKTVTFYAKTGLPQTTVQACTSIFSLWKDQQPLFSGKEYAGLSEAAIFAIGGILKHAGAISAFTNPTTNSYKRLVPGFEAPVHLAYSKRNRSAACLDPTLFLSPPIRQRIEVRFPDPSCNPYLAFSAITMAAIDGIQNKIDPGEPLENNIYDLPAEELAAIPKTPGSLNQALFALENDYQFLLRGDVFTEELISTWML